jgi:hypothetical protein
MPIRKDIIDRIKAMLDMSPKALEAYIRKLPRDERIIMAKAFNLTGRGLTDDVLKLWADLVYDEKTGEPIDLDLLKSLDLRGFLDPKFKPEPTEGIFPEQPEEEAPKTDIVTPEVEDEGADINKEGLEI